MGPACRDGCFEKIGDYGQRIFNDFWAIGNYDQQNQHLQSLIKIVPVKRSRTKQDDNKRQKMCNYFVKKDNVDTRVCRKAFLSLHGITKRKLETLEQKRRLSPTGTPRPDRRGKHPSSRKITGPVFDHVVEHIQSLPTTASHYTRSHAPDRRYMDSACTQMELFSNYISWMGENHPQELIVSPRFYKHVFRTNFNIVFRPPKTDLCNKCELFSARINARRVNGRDTRQLEEEEAQHKAAARVPQDLLSQAEVDAKTAPVDAAMRTIAMDLQQTLPCPQIRTGAAFYKRKLWLYNFCIYDLNEQKANMFVWDETIAHRGSDEIGSCISKWLDMMKNRGATFRNLRIYADNCAGQNKNIHIVLLALRIIHSRALDRIEIVFMVPGHSFLPCDRAFGHIEKKIRRRQSIYCPQDYAKIIQQAVGKENTVVMMQREDFLHIRKLKDAVVIRQSPGFSKARQLVIDANYPEGYVIKNTYVFDVFIPDVDRKVRLMPGRNAYSPHAFNLYEAADVPLKYPGVVSIASDKLGDLHYLWPYLDLKGRRWLNNLFQEQGQAPMDDELSEDEEDDPDDPEDPENNIMDYVAAPLLDLQTRPSGEEGTQ